MDYLAGFIGEFTGNNHLQELETCYAGGQGFIDDVKKVLHDIESGDYITAVGDFGPLVTELPEALDDCKNMTQDITKIETWALVFTEPYALMQEAVTNYMANGTNIMANLAKEKHNWAAGNYYEAGQDTAKVINYLIPFHDNEIASIIAESYGSTAAIDLADAGTETSMWEAMRAVGELL